MRNAILALLLALVAPVVADSCRAVAQQTEGFVVVVNAANEIESISKSDLSRIFLKRQSTWKNGDPIMPMDQEEGAPVRAAFTKRVHGRTMSAIRSYWEQQIFSGGEMPPVERASDEAVLQYARNNPAAIVYVQPGTALGNGVKAITVK